eukprot:scaffold227_cov173-Ochromonas_danica.AAC.3
MRLFLLQTYPISNKNDRIEEGWRKNLTPSQEKDSPAQQKKTNNAPPDALSAPTHQVPTHTHSAALTPSLSHTRTGSNRHTAAPAGRLRGLLKSENPETLKIFEFLSIIVVI